ncbi:VWA domain-containing protein [Nitrospira sp. BLG_2]|uniref:VWA domain-containing protein n=1 Tax=Nitrospira sp. BLG_2 TaxID=3397507 RepID=UPI003B9A31DF
MTDKQNGQPPMNPQPLYVTLILDETGSMQSCKGAAIAGFNQYLARLRQEPAETRFTLTLFNSSKTEVRYRGVPVSAVQELDVETYRPHDTTPLYDAIGRTLSAARQEAPAEAKKLGVILTDGLENASREYTRAQVFDLIKACEQQGWTFLYLGADHDVWAAGESLGVAGENRISFCKRDIGKTFDHLSETTARYRRGRSGQSKSSSRQDAAESKKGN